MVVSGSLAVTLVRDSTGGGARTQQGADPVEASVVLAIAVSHSPRYLFQVIVRTKLDPAEVASQVMTFYLRRACFLSCVEVHEE